MHTARKSRIKNTKTIIGAYIRDIDGVYRRLSTAKKCRQAIKHEIFLRHWLLQTPGEENPKKRKKDAPFLAMGENYIDKIFLFFLYFIYGCFYPSLTIRNPKDIVTEKGDKKSLLLFLSFIFYLSFRGRRLNHSSSTATHFISE